MRLNENELRERNNGIVMRYVQLMKAQPLATPSSVINYLAKDYDITPQQLGRILRENGCVTDKKNF